MTARRPSPRSIGYKNGYIDDFLARLPYRWDLVDMPWALTLSASKLNLFAEPLQAFGKRWLFVNEKVSTDSWGWMIYVGPPLRLLEFVAGMLVASASLAPRERGYRWRRHWRCSRSSIIEVPARWFSNGAAAGT